MTRRARTAALVLVALAAVATSARAQRPADGLEARMDAFLTALTEASPRANLTPFLPREGSWTWVATQRYDHRPDVVGRWRFDAAELATATGFDGPLCETFSLGGDAMVVGTLMHTIRVSDRRWRRVPGDRFVPADRGHGSRVFVQWRREDGRWVVSEVGDERFRETPLLGREVDAVQMAPGPYSPPRPPEERYAAGLAWFEENQPLSVEGELLVKYGPGREMDPAELVRLGVKDGVPVYVERAVRTNPEVVYLPISPGRFQPYQDTIGTGCRGG